MFPTFGTLQMSLPGGLVVRIRRSHRRGRGSIPRLGSLFFFYFHLTTFLTLYFETERYANSCDIRSLTALTY